MAMSMPVYGRINNPLLNVVTKVMPLVGRAKTFENLRVDSGLYEYDFNSKFGMIQMSPKTENSHPELINIKEPLFLAKVKADSEMQPLIYQSRQFLQSGPPMQEITGLIHSFICSTAEEMERSHRSAELLSKAKALLNKYKYKGGIFLDLIVKLLQVLSKYLRNNQRTLTFQTLLQKSLKPESHVSNLSKSSPVPTKPQKPAWSRAISSSTNLTSLHHSESDDDDDSLLFGHPSPVRSHSHSSNSGPVIGDSFNSPIHLSLQVAKPENPPSTRLFLSLPGEVKPLTQKDSLLFPNSGLHEDKTTKGDLGMTLSSSQLAEFASPETRDRPLPDCDSLNLPELSTSFNLSPQLSIKRHSPPYFQNYLSEDTHETKMGLLLGGTQNLSLDNQKKTDSEILNRNAMVPHVNFSLPDSSQSNVQNLIIKDNTLNKQNLLFKENTSDTQNLPSKENALDKPSHNTLDKQNLPSKENALDKPSHNTLDKQNLPSKENALDKPSHNTLDKQNLPSKENALDKQSYNTLDKTSHNTVDEQNLPSKNKKQSDTSTNINNNSIGAPRPDSSTEMLVNSSLRSLSDPPEPCGNSKHRLTKDHRSVSNLSAPNLLQVAHELHQHAQHPSLLDTPQSHRRARSFDSIGSQKSPESAKKPESSPRSAVKLQCRICEEAVQMMFFEMHTTVCAETHKWDMEASAQDENLILLQQFLMQQIEELHDSPQLHAEVLQKAALDNVESSAQPASIGEASMVTRIPSRDLKLLQRMITLCDLGQSSRVLEPLISEIKHITTLPQVSVVAGQILMYLLLKENALQKAENVITTTPRVYRPESPLLSRKGEKALPKIQDFVILKPLTEGGFGKVFLAQKKTTGDIFAVKVLKKSDMLSKNQQAHIKSERKILTMTAADFIINMYFAFQSQNFLYLVMEYAPGGDIFSMLMELETLPVELMIRYAAEITLALEYLHSNGIVHRDLKPDNLLIDKKGRIKLIDFGLSSIGVINKIESEQENKTQPHHPLQSLHLHNKNTKSEETKPRHRLHSRVGTPDYAAPEIYYGLGHSYEVDWWSLGVIVFECLVGFPPFNDKDPDTIFSNIINLRIPWKVAEESDISRMTPEAKDFISQLLVIEPDQRLGHTGANDIKRHHFFEGIAWDNLHKEDALFEPKVVDPTSTDYFEKRGEIFPVNGEYLSELDQATEVAPDQIYTWGTFLFVNSKTLQKINEDVFQNAVGKKISHKRSLSE